MTTIVRRRKLGMTSCKAISELSKTGIGWVRSDKKIPEDGLYIRWGCTVNLPGGGKAKVLNTAAAIHEVNDKAGFRMKLDEHELCPKTWLLTHPEQALWWEDLQNLGVIVRPSQHSRGKKLYHCLGPVHYGLTIQSLNYDGYASLYIPKVAEYRVFVVQGRAVCVAQKTPGNPDDVAWNVAKGGRFDNVKWDNWPLKVVKKSIAAFNLSSLDFGGVDVMVDADGECYVLEINSAPSLTSPYRQECMAKAFDYIVTNGKERIPLIEDKGGYLKFIHPAICERAKVLPNDFVLDLADGGIKDELGNVIREPINPGAKLLAVEGEIAGVKFKKEFNDNPMNADAFDLEEAPEEFPDIRVEEVVEEILEIMDDHGLDLDELIKRLEEKKDEAA